MASGSAALFAGRTLWWLADQRTAVEALTEQLTKPKPTDLATVADADVAQVLMLTRRPLRELETMAHPLADRAAAIVADRITHHAITQPSGAVLAELGERAQQPDPEVWNRAVGQAGLYLARWQTPPGEEIIAALPAQAPAAQAADHRSVSTAITDAQAARLITRPTADLAAERRQLLAQLAGTPHPDQRLLEANLDRAQDRLGRAQRAEQSAAADHGATLTPRARRRDPDGPERTRRILEHEQRATVVAHGGVAEARHALANLDNNVAARARVLGRIDAIDRALEPRVTQAVEQPAAYLTQTLGPRSDHEPKRWDGAATSIERYRHGTLGVNPDETLDARPETSQAIGPRPTDPIAAQGWDDVRTIVNHHNAPQIERSGLTISR